MNTKICIGCNQPQGKPHQGWCPVVTGTLNTLTGPDAPHAFTDDGDVRGKCGRCGRYDDDFIHGGRPERP